MIIPSSIFTNPWIIGIGGGTVSGLVVFVITRVIFGRRENREYHQKVLAANRELLHGLRPTVAENQIPERNVIEAMHASTARRFGVMCKDMASIDELVEDLTMEVMESSFISSQVKAEFCQKISSLLERPAELEKANMPYEFHSLSRLRAEQRGKLVTMVSATVAVMVGMTTALIPLLSKLTDDVPREMSLYVLILAIPAMSAVMMAYLMVFMKRFVFRDRSSEKHDDKDLKKSDE